MSVLLSVTQTMYNFNGTREIPTCHKEKEKSYTVGMKSSLIYSPGESVVAALAEVAVVGAAVVRGGRVAGFLQSWTKVGKFRTRC